MLYDKILFTTHILYKVITIQYYEWNIHVYVLQGVAWPYLAVFQEHLWNKQIINNQTGWRNGLDINAGFRSAYTLMVDHINAPS